MTSEETDRRRSHRIKVELPALLVTAEGVDRCETAEVGLGGVFVVTSRSYELHQLVQLEVTLPAGQTLATEGMVVRVVGLDDAAALSTAPGVGIQFYGLGQSDESEWKGFVASVSGAGTPPPADTALDAQAVPPGPGRSEIDSRTAKWKPSIEELARAAGIDPRIFAAAVCDEEEASDEAAGSPRDTLVEGVAARTEASQADRAAPGPTPGPRTSHAALGPHAKPIHIIGPADAPPAPRESPAPAKKKIDPDRTVAGFRVLEESSDGFTPAELAVVLDQGLADAAPEAARDDAKPTIPRMPAVSAPRPDRTSDDAAPRQESVAIVPLAPTGLLRQAVYRLELPSVAALEQFSQLALGSGGVFVRTDDLRPGGSPAIVCVVHPTSRDEFHIPGTIVQARRDRAGVSIRFAGVTADTYRAFREFVALGARRPAAPRPGSKSGSYLTMARPETRRPGQGTRAAIPSDTRAVTPDSIEPYPKRRTPV